MTDHNPFAVAERLAPVPATREQATYAAWIRHHAAVGLAAFTEFQRAMFARLDNPTAEPAPHLGYLTALGVAAMHAAVALAGDRSDTPERLWDLTPEAGALNGEWEDWLVKVLDQIGINPADINPDYNAADFRSPVRAIKEDTHA